MYTRYYDSYPAMPPVKTTAKEEVTTSQEVNETIQVAKLSEISENIAKSESTGTAPQIASKNSLFHSVQADDIILVALPFLLLSESDDVIMLIIIGFLLIGDKLPF